MVDVVQSKILLQPTTTATKTGWYLLTFNYPTLNNHTVWTGAKVTVLLTAIHVPELQIIVGYQTFTTVYWLWAKFTGQTVWMHDCIQNVTGSSKTQHPAFQTGNRYINIELCSSEKIESNQLLGSQVMERNALWMWNATFWESSAYYCIT